MRLKTLDQVNVAKKTVLVRVDLNVPMEHGKVADMTRIHAILPTIRELADKGAKVVLLAHFERPKGKFVPALSLAPLVDVLESALNAGEDRSPSEPSSAPHVSDRMSRSGGNYKILFGVDCIGNMARKAINHADFGEIVLLENVRFHAGEEVNDPEFAKELASLGDIFVGDAFSASHRAHASVSGIADYLPAYAGRLLQQEVEAFDRLLLTPKRPLAAIVGGAKISTKLEILDHLLEKVDYLIIGGAMANTFLLAQGKHIGKSLHEPELVDTARNILAHAGEKIILPKDFTVARAFAASPACEVVRAEDIPADAMQLDVGPETVLEVSHILKKCQSLVWNGPFGAFETKPFDASTVVLARMAASLTRTGTLFSLAGGGDTVSALNHAGLADQFSYLSTAGGAFLEWMQGKELPGVKVLEAR